MIQLNHVSKTFDGTSYVLNDVNLTIPPGESTCIIGQSGQGKSILLKLIIGLMQPTHGSITVNGIDTVHASDDMQNDILKACGYVFQFAALLDSLSVCDNIALSLLEHGLSREEAEPIVKHKLKLVNLTPDILDKYPDQLSGGMKKRVGLARTLVSEPSIILYDEPTTGLDPITTTIIHELIHRMQRDMQITSVIISHNTDIFHYVDNIALLHDTGIQFFGKARDIWQSDNPYIQQFIHGSACGLIRTEHE